MYVKAKIQDIDFYIVTVYTSMYNNSNKLVRYLSVSFRADVSHGRFLDMLLFGNKIKIWTMGIPLNRPILRMPPKSLILLFFH